VREQFEPAPASAGTRGAFLLTLVVLALILTVAAQSRPDVREARISRRVELVELIRREQARVNALSARAEELAAEIAAAQRSRPGDPKLADALSARLDEIGPSVGLTAVRGPGVVVTLTDAPSDEAGAADLNDLVIHEQDLQAVINALWAGGAEAMSVNGERVLATTAIRCVGNTLLLHGSVYSPPYQIRVVGDREAMTGALGRDEAVAHFRRAVEEFGLGFEVATAERLDVPAFNGTVSLVVAKAARGGGA
jgi:uncharacterized protein YlxW (UPF0749 family)